MVSIDTPLLVSGAGPASLLVAKFASGRGLASLVIDHTPSPPGDPVVLDPAAVALLTPHGLFDVLRPYLASIEPAAIAPELFDDVVKHHCVADMNVTIYDGMRLEADTTPGDDVDAVLTDGTSRWDVHAERYVDAAQLPATLPAAVHEAASVAAAALGDLRSA